MNVLKCLFVLIFAGLISTAPAEAQGWGRHQMENCNCSIEFPSEPRVVSSEDNLFTTLIDTANVYLISCTDFRLPVDSAQYKKLCRQALRTFADERGIEPTSTQDWKGGIKSGFSKDKEGNNYRYAVLMKENKQIQIACRVEDETLAGKFFNSFRAD